MVRLLIATLLVAATVTHAKRDAKIARGEYLARRVAMCVQCHTPRTATGELDATKLFQGAPVPVSAPPFPNQQWAAQAPNIAGLTGVTDEDEIRLLMTGERPSRPAPLPPMPPFRLARADAEAIVAYLRSLTARQGG